MMLVNLLEISLCMPLNSRKLLKCADVHIAIWNRSKYHLHPASATYLAWDYALFMHINQYLVRGQDSYFESLCQMLVVKDYQDWETSWVQDLIPIFQQIRSNCYTGLYEYLILISKRFVNFSIISWLFELIVLIIIIDLACGRYDC